MCNKKIFTKIVSKLTVFSPDIKFSLILMVLCMSQYHMYEKFPKTD